MAQLYVVDTVLYHPDDLCRAEGPILPVSQSTVRCQPSVVSCLQELPSSEESPCPRPSLRQPTSTGWLMCGYKGPTSLPLFEPTPKDYLSFTASPWDPLMSLLRLCCDDTTANNLLLCNLPSLLFPIDVSFSNPMQKVWLR